MKNIETVHVVFKTHLDIGFTDLAENVIHTYMDQFIPKAIELAEQLAADLDEPAEFIWTTGSWLIDRYLRQGTPENRKIMENAIARGYITWHGLPFTTHTELLDDSLFNYGLSISEHLDQQYGKKTIAAKMTDVPGHTRAIIPHMARNGIEYLHIGVNGASKVPNVPELFVWRGKDGSELIVNYDATYGSTIELEGLKDVMVFAHTGDNNGPPSIDAVKQQFAYLQEQYPGAVIRASTMDAFAKKLLPFKSQLPVIEEEIGDSWIHGAASDPKKVAQYRELLRLRTMWLSQGRLHKDTNEYYNLSDKLLLIAEHTWGMDEKLYLADYQNYSKDLFAAAREADVVTFASVPAKYLYIGLFDFDLDNFSLEQLSALTNRQKSYRYFESSWKEQRDFVYQAIEALSEDKKEDVRQAFHALEPVRSTELSTQDAIIPGTMNQLGCFEVAFDSDGSITKLIDRNGKVWANEQHRLGVYRYESFGSENYQTWFEQYVSNSDKTYIWSDGDFGKPGIELNRPKPTHAIYSPQNVGMTVERNQASDIVRIRLQMPSHAVKEAGAPAELEIEWLFPKHLEKIEVTLKWFDKQANRLPEAGWFSFALNTDNPNRWLMDKMGERISPHDVVKNGNRNLHAVNTGLHYNSADGIATIETLDAPIVSPGEGRLLQFDNTVPSLDGGFHFLLHNNIWGTNFPMWYEDDAVFRFTLTLTSTQSERNK